MKDVDGFDYDECWKCGGTKEVEEPVCGLCESGINHSHCDDTWVIKVPCDACGERKDPQNKPRFSRGEY